MAGGARRVAAPAFDKYHDDPADTISKLEGEVAALKRDLAAARKAGRSGSGLGRVPVGRDDQGGAASDVAAGSDADVQVSAAGGAAACCAWRRRRPTLASLRGCLRGTPPAP